VAIASYRKAIEIDPKQPIAYNNLAAMSVERRQDLASAERWARKAVELGPGVADFHDTLGWVLHARGNDKGALSALQKATELAPNNPEILYHLAAIRVAAGDKAKAREALEKAFDASGAFPSSAEAKKLLADLER
jgi:Flp pilus assembly protein TadD